AEFSLQHKSVYSLEKELVGNYAGLMNNPSAFLAALKRRVAWTLNNSPFKFAVRVYEMAAVNATRGLIQAMGLDKQKIIILYSDEIDARQAAKLFPGYEIRAFKGFYRPDVIHLDFHDFEGITVTRAGEGVFVDLPYVPFKFNLPAKISARMGELKEELGTASRKVIVIGSPSDEEFGEFMDTYNTLYGNLPYSQRPLLIIGFRQRRDQGELKLLGSLSGQSIVVRSDDAAPMPRLADHNVLILNTNGELREMYGLADVAVIGDDRNIFEPASQGAAVLYFEGDWTYNKEGKEALSNGGAAEVFNFKNFLRLMADPKVSTQMGRHGLEVVNDYRTQVRLRAEEFGLEVIGTGRELRDLLISPPDQAMIVWPDQLSTNGDSGIKDLVSPKGRYREFTFTDGSKLTGIDYETSSSPVIVWEYETAQGMILFHAPFHIDIDGLAPWRDVFAVMRRETHTLIGGPSAMDDRAMTSSYFISKSIVLATDGRQRVDWRHGDIVLTGNGSVSVVIERRPDGSFILRDEKNQGYVKPVNGSFQLGDPESPMVIGVRNGDSFIIVNKRLPSLTVSYEVPDRAMSASQKKTGGIDLTPVAAGLQVRSAGLSIKFKLASSQLERLRNSAGFMPEIIDIQPLGNLQDFLGISNAH
ncbi:MAG: hypothetical protein KGJ11_06265, partial [Candidatus Omnitrophica bacterium]|nr:hypothetical protein [Candidatus Omnitrophota bacterium]